MQSHGQNDDDIIWYDFNKSIELYLNAIKNDTNSSLPLTQQQNQPIMRELMPFATNENPCNFCAKINSAPHFQGPPLLESKSHVLTTCPGYHELRSNLSVELKSLVVRADYKHILNSSSDMINEFKRYIEDCTTVRNSLLAISQKQKWPILRELIF